MQQVVQPRPSSNGFARRKGDRDTGARLDNKLPPNLPTFTNAAGTKSGAFANPSHDRLVYLATCLIGHPVQVQVKNGSTYSGIFHANDKDFAIVLKMAHLLKEGSFKLHKFAPDFFIDGLTKTMVIPAKDLVHVTAKEVALTGNQINDMLLEQSQDIPIDSYISQFNFVEVERELGRWAPDEDDPQCPELENIFDGTWNRHWDQFETNAALFGVKSTFDEELYTTKLERGPQMRDLERKAVRIAKEMEGEETLDLHMAEERGIDTNGDFDIDEETKYSSVYRGITDSGYEENEDIVLDAHNTETFGGPTDSFISKSFSDTSRRKTNDGNHASSSFSSLDGAQPSQATAGRDLHRSGSSDYAGQFDGESRIRENQLQAHANKISTEESAEKKKLTGVSDSAQNSKLIGIQSLPSSEKMNSDKGGLCPSATAYAPSSCSKDQVQPDSLGESSETPGSGKTHAVTQPGNLRGRPGSSASSNSERAAAASAFGGPGLSPSSSMGSLASEKSTLNPFAKEFKLNPNAKSFTPFQAPLRPTSPISDGSYYFQANASSVPQMHAVPVGIGMAPSFGGPQSIVYNPQGAPMQSSPQAYIHPNGPLYGQQMIVGHPRQVLYMPNYPPDMQYKGRDF